MVAGNPRLLAEKTRDALTEMLTESIRSGEKAVILAENTHTTEGCFVSNKYAGPSTVQMGRRPLHYFAPRHKLRFL